MAIKMYHSKRKTPTVEISVTCPRSLSATSGDVKGEIDLAWEPVAGAYTYVIQKCKDSKVNLKWINEDIVAKSSYTVSNLRSGLVYRFRVAAVGTQGQGKWSKSVQKKVP